jgi:YHS domain-containing protein
MIRLFRLLLLLLLFFLLRSVLRSIFAGPRPSDKPRTPVPTGGELKKDPVCGTYVSTAVGISEKINGELIYFCSQACRDKYRISTH